MDQATAIDRLRSMVAADIAPTLTDGELGRLLDSARLADPAGNPPGNTATVTAWAASTVYLVDQLIKTSTRYWRCIVPGTTSTTAPTWPPLTGFAIVDDYQVIDGGVTWVDNGTQWRPTWNLNAAAAEGWRWKAAQIAAAYDFTTDGQTFNRSQQVAQCQSMAATYDRKAGVRSIPIVTANPSSRR